MALCLWMEIELQYLYGGTHPLMVPAELAGFALGDSSIYDIRDAFYDTPQLDLRRSGCSLRIRRQSNRPKPILTWKGPSQTRDDGAREREEIELAIDHLPADGPELLAMLRSTNLKKRTLPLLPDDPVLAEIGEIENRRSSHFYTQGLHRIELCWDRIEFPLGEPQIRLEIETKSETAGRFIRSFDEELRLIHGDRLRPASHGKAKEMCLRLYPEIVGQRASA